MVRLGLILSGAVLIGLAAPAAARISVADYLQSYAALKKVESVPETERSAYMAEHSAELSQATHVQEQAATTYETLLAADEASFARYRRNLLCNFIEEDQPISFKTMVEEHIEELRAEKNLSDAEIADRLRYTDFSDVLVDKMLDHYECPTEASEPEAASVIARPERASEVTAPAR